jgi:hypothetical protein
MKPPLPMVIGFGRVTWGLAGSPSQGGSLIQSKGVYLFGPVSVRDFVMCNHSSDPMFASVTPAAGHPARLP